MLKTVCGKYDTVYIYIFFSEIFDEKFNDINSIYLKSKSVVSQNVYTVTSIECIFDEVLKKSYLPQAF